MKATFFALATLAASVFAAPAKVARDDGITDVIPEATEILDVAGVNQILEGVSTGPLKRDITSGLEVIQLLESLVGSVKGQTGAINGTLAKVQDGSMNKDDAEADVTKQLQDMHFKLTDILTKVLGSAGLNVANGDVDKVLNLVVVLVSEVLFTVKSLVTILGLRPQLVSLLHSVFNIVAGLLKVLIGLLAGLLPGLVAALSPLLAGLGNGLLVPLLTPIVGLLAGLSLPGQ